MGIWRRQTAEKHHQNKDTITTIIAGRTPTGPAIEIVGWMLVVLLPTIFFVAYFLISGKLML